MIRIVDASAIGAVLLLEREATWVNEQTEGMELLAPSILPFEVGNVAGNSLRRSAAEADSIMAIWAGVVRIAAGASGRCPIQFEHCDWRMKPA